MSSEKAPGLPLGLSGEMLAVTRPENRRIKKEPVLGRMRLPTAVEVIPTRTQCSLDSYLLHSPISRDVPARKNDNRTRLAPAPLDRPI